MFVKTIFTFRAIFLISMAISGAACGGTGVKSLPRDQASNQIDSRRQSQNTVLATPKIANTTARSLADDIIQNEIRSHIDEIRLCYETALTHHHNLQGNVSVKFIIDQTGDVMLASIANSDLHQPAMEKCIADIITRMHFPAFENGKLIVTHPFNFALAQNY